MTATLLCLLTAVVAEATKEVTVVHTQAGPVTITAYPMRGGLTTIRDADSFMVIRPAAKP